MNAADRSALDVLDIRLKTILPEEYQESYKDLEPVSMGSAGLKYASDGKVAWDQIWGSFCNLAMAGGPPHKGTLLEPGTREQVDAKPVQYGNVMAEICRGIEMATYLEARPAPEIGWVRVDCLLEGMAQWLLRAIVVENVAVRCHGTTVDLPVAPHFRLDKEIKNVVTVIAKTCHYWMGHMPRTQQWAIAELFATMAAESTLVEPGYGSRGGHAEAKEAVTARVADAIQQTTGLSTVRGRYSEWIGVECPDVRHAVWMMRALVVSNVLARREGTVLFVPVNPASDPDGGIVSRAVARIHALAAVQFSAPPAA